MSGLSAGEIQRQHLLQTLAEVRTKPGVVDATTAARAHELLAEQRAHSRDLALFLPDQPVRYLPSPKTVFRIRSREDKTEIERLKAALLTLKSQFGINDESALGLYATAVQVSGRRIFVRFIQVFQRKPGKQFGYMVPILSANLTAILDAGRLAAINSGLVPLPSVKVIQKNPGFDFGQLSQNEFNTLARYIRESPKRDRIKAYFDRYAKDAGLAFDLYASLAKDGETARNEFNDFFNHIGSTSTVKGLIDLATRGRLALVRYGNGPDAVWMIQVTHFLDLPLQFDIVFPHSEHEQLTIKNLRELHRDVAISIYSSPDYPRKSGQRIFLAETEDSPVSSEVAGARTAEVMQNVIRYFKSEFNWVGDNGHAPNFDLKVHTGLRSPIWQQNAAWMGAEDGFEVGAGGPMFAKLENSISVLGHEFAHAIVENTCDLVYSGESGGLNEHFADIQGASVKAKTRGQPFDFLIGEDIITQGLSTQRGDALASALQTSRLSPEVIKAYSLNTVALRHLYAPGLSVARQFVHPREAIDAYGPACQPSVDNDNCGVHALSGIPNRAVSYIIADLGFEKTRHLIFDTVTLRLNRDSSFREYARQLYQECLVSPGLDAENECPLILTDFAAAGVAAPEMTAAPSASAVAPAAALAVSKPTIAQPKPVAPPGPPNQPARTNNSATSAYGSAIYKVCGWVQRAPSGNMMIVDNRYNAEILLNGHAHPTEGDVSALVGAKCGCATGRLANSRRPQGGSFNYFLSVFSAQAQRDEVCEGEHR